MIRIKRHTVQTLSVEVSQPKTVSPQPKVNYASPPKENSITVLGQSLYRAQIQSVLRQTDRETASRKRKLEVYKTMFAGFFLLLAVSGLGALGYLISR